MVLPMTAEFAWFIVFHDCWGLLRDHSDQPALCEQKAYNNVTITPKASFRLFSKLSLFKYDFPLVTFGQKKKKYVFFHKIKMCSDSVFRRKTCGNFILFEVVQFIFSFCFKVMAENDNKSAAVYLTGHQPKQRHCLLCKWCRSVRGQRSLFWVFAFVNFVLSVS